MPTGRITVGLGCRWAPLLPDRLRDRPESRAGTWIGEIHERAAPLAAHLKVDISHSHDSSAELPESYRLHVDLSGMSRILIVQVVAALVRSAHCARSEVLYCSAKVYPPKREKVETKLAERTDLLGQTMFLSAGVFGLTIVPELSSVAMQGQPIRVITFPSWNTTQLWPAPLKPVQIQR